MSVPNRLRGAHTQTVRDGLSGAAPIQCSLRSCPRAARHAVEESGRQQNFCCAIGESFVASYLLLPWLGKGNLLIQLLRCHLRLGFPCRHATSPPNFYIWRIFLWIGYTCPQHVNQDGKVVAIPMNAYLLTVSTSVAYRNYFGLFLRSPNNCYITICHFINGHHNTGVCIALKHFGHSYSLSSPATEIGHVHCR